ncbi:urease accessory protein UreD [Loktanella agnita]
MISSLRQQGSLKALFPHRGRDMLDAVFLNTAGGLTGGDVMEISVAAEEGTSVSVSSQAAERAYRAQPGPAAQMNVRLQVGKAARAHWLPQETILFDGAALDRRLHVDLAPDARALIVEPLIFGRAAMGETLQNLHFTDQWRVRRDAQLVFADAVRITDATLARMQSAALTSGAIAMATILLAAPDAAAFASVDLPPEAGISLISDDLLLVRMLAADSFILRKTLVPLVETLSQSPIPRVWRL